ncbi:hypothetical protein [Chitinophaga sp.]|uniref:hypothetical protein n=1 Tax=Chitinophaga sp. TaxID=1869181 RepID=UPI002611C54C|nr:hypothetical protein [uncultured Chitinophaga sp.]
MTGTLYQIVTLAAYGNAFLKNRIRNPDLSANLSFQHCNSVTFKVLERPFLFMNKKEKVAAANPADWFRFLQDGGCQKLRLHYSPSKDQSAAKDYKLAGFVGGGGTWVIEAVYLNYSEAWAGRWEVTQKDHPDNQIWSVTYMRIPSQFKTQDLQIPQQQAKDTLEEALANIESFALAQNEEGFGKTFSKARKTLSADTPEQAYYNKHLVPNDYFSLTARQLLYAAGTAWVFGGMGSWNDLSFGTDEDNATYEALTERLYHSVNQAVLCAVNSY